jgi:hypothetical protein
MNETTVALVLVGCATLIGAIWILYQRASQAAAKADDKAPAGSAKQ